MTITTVRAAIQLIHEPEIDSLWEYEHCHGWPANAATISTSTGPRWAAYTEGQLCDLNGSSTALKHDGKITGMGLEFLDTHKEEWTRVLSEDAVDYPVSPETKRWWEGKHDCDPQKFSDRYYVKLLTQIIDRECNEAMETTQHGGTTAVTKARMNLKNMLAESSKVKRMLREASDAMEETTWED